MTKPIEKGTMRPEKKLRKYGYEYTLVECGRDIYPAAALGIKGYVLKSVRKLNKDE